MTTLANHSGFWMRDDAAQAFNRVEADHGLFTVNSAGRTEAEQNDFIARWDRGGAANRPPYLYAPARPATASNHVSHGGIAIDLGNWQSFLSVCAPYGFTHPFPTDVVHFEFHGVAATTAPAQAPSAGASNPFGIPSTKGLQKIANLYGAQTALDDQFGPKSMAGFTQFLRANYGYVGNNVLGPIMWSAIANWLRSRWGYVGNDIAGPIMRAHLANANDENFAQL